MPSRDILTIHVNDLKNILNQLEAEGVGNRYVKIVDNNAFFTIRDTSDFQIANIKKDYPINTSITKNRIQ